MEAITTKMHWETVTYTWEVKDFLDLREMAQNEREFAFTPRNLAGEKGGHANLSRS